MVNMLALGTKTAFGEVSAITFIDGERYYFLIDKNNTVSMLPEVYFLANPPEGEL